MHLILGWLCSQNKDIIDQVELFKDYTSFCPPAPSEILALICLRNRDKLIKRTMDIVNPNLDILDQFFKDHSGTVDWYQETRNSPHRLFSNNWTDL